MCWPQRRSSTLLFLAAAICRCPALFGYLAASANGESVGGNFARDAGAGADVRSVSDGDGSYQRRVAAHKDALADYGGVFVHAIVIAGDDACADIRTCAD